MKILVCNVGSTSLKLKLFQMPGEKMLVESKIDSINNGVSATFTYKDCYGTSQKTDAGLVETYSDGIQIFLDCLLQNSQDILRSMEDIKCVAFKTVMARGYLGTHELTDDVLNAMKDYSVIAPAHNIPYLLAIQELKKIFKGATFVGSFETDFHKTIPEYRRVYGIPYEWTETYNLKKMGFHGASHNYIAQVLKEEYGEDSKIISCHLGGSSSLCAIDQGQSIDSSFGFAPQSGIIHSKRNGDIDLAVVQYLVAQGMTFEAVMEQLYTNGGLAGISGCSGDFKDVLAQAKSGNHRANLALEVFCNDIIKHIGMLFMELKGLNSIVFTGGIGENSSTLRSYICSKLAFLGVELDPFFNDRPSPYGLISRPTSSVRVFVIPTNEELIVAKKAFSLLTQNTFL